MNPTTSYAEKQERKRKLTSIGITAGLYLLAFAVGLVLEILNPREEDYSNMTVMITMPGPTTNEVGLGSFKPSEEGETAEKIEPSAPKKTETVVEKAEAPRVESPKKPVEEAAPSPSQAVAKAAPPPASKPEPSETVAVAAAPTQASPGSPSAIPSAQAASVPDSAAEETPPAEPWVPGQREQGSHISQTSTMLYVPGKGLVPYSGETVTISRSQKGSSWEIVLGGSKDTVGRGLGTLVEDSLPLPFTVPVEIFNNINDQIEPPNRIINSAQARKRAFTNFYKLDGSVYRLNTNVPLEYRDDIWLILEDAGFNAADAKEQYRRGKNLQPIIIGFSVRNDNKPYEAVVTQSTGDPDLDEAIMYGFKNAAFWKKSDEALIPGRFTYRY